MKFLLHPHMEYKLQISDWCNQSYRSANFICACLVFKLCETFHLRRFLDRSLSPNPTQNCRQTEETNLSSFSLNFSLIENISFFDLNSLIYLKDFVKVLRRCQVQLFPDSICNLVLVSCHFPIFSRWWCKVNFIVTITHRIFFLSFLKTGMCCFHERSKKEDGRTGYHSFERYDARLIQYQITEIL